MSKITLTSLGSMKSEGKKIAVLTAYDAMFARTLEAAGIDVLLVGDSLGMVLQGRESTLPVTVDEMIYHTRMVSQGAGSALVMTDMPFMSYISPEHALENAGRIMKEGGAHVVKLEGGNHFLDTVTALSRHSVPVCAHLGLQPQSVNKLGGYRVQGSDEESAASIYEDAMAMEAAGADMMLLECVPASLAKKITDNLGIPVIGIGAGPSCDGQVLVLHDMLGMGVGKPPKFVKDFLTGSDSIRAAVEGYVREVREGEYPGQEHSFS